MNQRPTAQNIADSCNGKIAYMREHYFSRKAEIAMDLIAMGLVPNPTVDEYMIHCDGVVTILLDQLSAVSELACILAHENESLGVDTSLSEMQPRFSDEDQDEVDEQLNLFDEDVDNELDTFFDIEEEDDDEPDEK